MDPAKLKAALAANFDRVITPEVAASIFAAACEPDDKSIDPEQFGQDVFGGCVIRAESFKDCLDELHPMHVAHWQETEKHRHGFHLTPDYDAVLASERAGKLVQFTVRDMTGKLVGNLRMYLGTSRHSSTLFAQEDTLYLSPEVRGGGLALRLLRFAEKSLLALGVREIRADSKLVNNADVLMRRMGYEPVALKFVKIFKED